MGWDDIVRAHWTRHPGALALEFVRTYVHIFRHIGAARVCRLYRPAFHAGALPLWIVFGPLLAAPGLGAAFGAWGWMAGALVAAAVWGLATRGGLFWLLRIYTFFMRMAQGPIPGLAQRTREWVDAIVAMQQAEPVDEVLLVGHSVGTLVMTDAVAALLRDARWQALQAGRPTLLLTLGQSYPMVALAPSAQAFRETLQGLCTHPRLRWWDVTARIDPLCFHGLAPIAGTLLAGEKDARWPVRHAARFMHMYEPARWRQIRADKLQAHFLYLQTPQKPGNFSPMDVLYGPRGLAQQMQAQGERLHA
ncbi:hypothetical protein [Ramlibacter rhizophilus]|uniref:Alpha/beta hydrolase n=1 Tax=Ramlibacter rhizophilus TaxID=1781167 RepID=A0A4Z0BNS3_9BURK|nr:hypothetical protein [Ramlibacter rhizophilus]TFY99917.1 hypothetical protein EZ242_12345 [Ramlibacter rhizophilus]